MLQQYDIVQYETIEQYESRKRKKYEEIDVIKQHFKEDQNPKKKKKRNFEPTYESIFKLETEIDHIDDEEDKYIEATRQQCMICKGFDSRWCICHEIFPSAVLIPFLIYQKRCIRGEIQLPLIPKRVFVDIIYPYVILDFLERIAEATFQRDIVHCIYLEDTDDDDDFYKRPYYEKRLKEEKEKLEQKKDLLIHYFDGHFLANQIINDHNF